MLRSLGIACLVLLAAAAPGGAGAETKLAETPAFELLETLGLLRVAPREGLRMGAKSARPDGSWSIRITLDAKAPSAPFSARGLGILQVELANVKFVDLRSFDLLYNAGGRIIGVFPVLPGDVGEKWEVVQPKYFDISPYYMDVPRSGDPSELERWAEFSRGFERDQASIDAFLEERYKALLSAYPNFKAIRLPYRLHEVDSLSGRWESHEFSPSVFGHVPATGSIVSDMEPAEFLRLFLETPPGRRRTVIPTFPTVYTLSNMTPAELEYLRLVSKKFELSADADILVVGPGTGVDAWIASLRTRRPVVVIGINPLEVANTRATAKIAGFRVRAIVGDNVADEDGAPRLPGERFDAVFWNMPAVWPEGYPEKHAPSMSQFWDGDVGAVVLKRFARALPALLAPEGRALLWNHASFVDGRDIVAGILESADTGGKVFNVEVELFARRRRPKVEHYKERLYTVSRPR